MFHAAPYKKIPKRYFEKKIYGINIYGTVRQNEKGSVQNCKYKTAGPFMLMRCAKIKTDDSILSVTDAMSLHFLEFGTFPLYPQSLNIRTLVCG